MQFVLLYYCLLQRATVRACHMPCCPVFLSLYCIVIVFERNKWRWRWRSITCDAGREASMALGKAMLTQLLAM